MMEVTEKEYRTHPAVSRSELFKMCDSPEKFKHYKENPPEPKPSLVFGQLFHKMILEPETLFDEFIIKPEVDGRTKEGKAIKQQFEEKSVGKTIVTVEQFQLAEEMKAALMENELATKLLEGEHEVPYFWTDEKTKEPCKMRADCIHDTNSTSIVVDLKTASSADTDTFAREAIKYGYDFQSGMYTEGANICRGKKHLFVFVVIEKEPPYSINILQADELFIKRGNRLFHEMLKLYHECKETDNWYGYTGKDNHVNFLDLPSWLAKEVE